MSIPQPRQADAKLTITDGMLMLLMSIRMQMTTFPGLWIIDKSRDASNDFVVLQLFGQLMAEKKIFLDY